MTDQVNSTGEVMDQDEFDDPGTNQNSPDQLLGENSKSGALSSPAIIGSKTDQRDRVSQSRSAMDSLRQQYAAASSSQADAYAEQRKVLEQARDRLLNMQVGPSQQEQALRMASVEGEAGTGRYDPGAHNAARANLLQQTREAEMTRQDLLNKYGMEIPQAQIGSANSRLNQLTQQMRIEQSGLNSASTQANKSPPLHDKYFTQNPNNPDQWDDHPEQRAADVAQAVDTAKQKATNAAAIKASTQKAMAGGQFDPQELDFLANQYNENPQSLVGLTKNGAIIPVIKRATQLSMAAGNTGASVVANQQLVKSQNGLLKDFQTGATAKALDGINTSVKHAEVLSPLIDQLGNGDVQIFNRLHQYLATQLGETAPTDFETTKKFLAGEVAKAVLPAGGGEAEREGIAADMSKAESPQQLQSALGRWKQLLAGKTDATRLRWNSWTDGKFGDFDQKFLLPETQKALGVKPKPAAPVPGAAPAGPTPQGQNALVQYYNQLGAWKAGGQQGPAPVRPQGV